MLFNLFFIVPLKISDTFSGSEIATANLTILVNSKELVQEWDKLLDVFLLKNTPYTLCIDCSGAPLAQLIPNLNRLVLLSFGKNYIKPLGIPSLHFIVSNIQYPKDIESFEASLATAFHTQGYREIKTTFIRKEEVNALSNSHTYLMLDPKNEFGLFKNWISKLYENHSVIHSAIYVAVHSSVDVMVFQKEMDEVNRFLKNQYPIEHKLLTELKQLVVEKKQLQASLSILREKLKTIELNHSLIKAENREGVTTIKEWYNNEYEVLPLWYKRFGHLIKWIMGKRSFKSLFKN